MSLYRTAIRSLFARIVNQLWIRTVTMPFDFGSNSLSLPSMASGSQFHSIRNKDLALPAVLYQSDNYIIVDKGYDVKVNSDVEDEVTVAVQVSQLFPELIDDSVAHRFRFTHRLDYPTTGVLCLALNKKAAGRVSKAFAKRTITKHYLALVRGHVQDETLLIDKPLGKDSNIQDVHRMCVYGTPGCEDVKRAKTFLIRLESGSYNNDPATKVLLVPYTGRTHQLRVHCAHIGHLIVGDYTYSNRTDTEPFRMMLHSYRLILPNKTEGLDVCAPDPFLPEHCPLWKTEQVHRTYTEASEMFNSLSTEENVEET